MQQLNKKNSSKELVILFIHVLLFLLLSTINLERVPGIWRDEGWTVNVARNWVELGHYGQLIAGQPSGPGLSAALPVVAPVALSFRILGIGVWQARLPSVIFLLGSLVLIFYLAYQLYNRAIATMTLFVLLFLSGANQFHPLTLGRTVMGEIPMIFYLLCGYTLLFLSLRKSRWLIIPTALFWGIAIKTKAQVLPFWAISLLIPLIILLLKRRWRTTLLLLAGIILAWMTTSGVDLIRSQIESASYQSQALPGGFESIALVTKLHIRVPVLGYTLTIGLLTLVGFLIESWNSFTHYHEEEYPSDIEIIKLALLGFVGSWLAWYALLSLGFDRYLFPALFIGSIFSAAIIYKLTQGFDIKYTIRSSAKALSRRRTRSNFGALIVLLAFAMTFPVTVGYLARLFLQPGTPVSEVTSYIEENSDPQDLIETYESELYFLLDRNYHYPPDNIALEFFIKYLLVENESYDYNPLDSDPDFLVIGNYADLTHIYESALSSGKFELIKSFPDYEIYARVRE